MMSYLCLLGLRDLRISTRVFDEISFACDGQSVVLSVGDGNAVSTNTSGVAMSSGIGLPTHTGKNNSCCLSEQLTYNSSSMTYLELYPFSMA